MVGISMPTLASALIATAVLWALAVVLPRGRRRQVMRGLCATMFGASAYAVAVDVVGEPWATAAGIAVGLVIWCLLWLAAWVLDTPGPHE